MKNIITLLACIVLAACNFFNSDDNGVYQYTAYAVDDYVIGAKAEFFEVGTNKKALEATTQDYGRIQVVLDSNINY